MTYRGGDGVHGVTQSSGACSYREALAAQGGVAGFGSGSSSSLLRIEVTGDEKTEGRDWTIYEAIDTRQWTTEDETAALSVEILAVDGCTAVIGRDRTKLSQFTQEWGQNAQPFSGFPNGDQFIGRARARSFRGSGLNFSAKTRALYLPGENPRIKRLTDNYRAWVTEGRPSWEYVPDYLRAVSPEILDSAPGQADIDFGRWKKIPDFAQHLITAPTLEMLAYYNATSGLSSGWVVCFTDVFGDRYPGASADVSKGAMVPLWLGTATPYIPIPTWATYLCVCQVWPDPVPAPSLVEIPVQWGLYR